MKDLKKIQSIEAMKRIELLKVHKDVLEDFKKGILHCSKEMGALFYLNEFEKKLVNEFEKVHNATVYHLILNNTSFGKLYSLLYVSKYIDEWTYDIDDLADYYPVVYVKNCDVEQFSEFGRIEIRPIFGGLIRIN